MARNLHTTAAKKHNFLLDLRMTGTIMCQNNDWTSQPHHLIKMHVRHQLVIFIQTNAHSDSDQRYHIINY